MDELRLDGNALAGLLEELFGYEMTQALSACAGCGATEPVGAEHAYVQAPGAVLRCCHCDNVLMVAVEVREEYVLAFPGLRSLRLTPET